MLINRDGTCRLAGGDAEIFLGRECKDMLTTTIFSGRAGALALDVITASLGSERPHIREIASEGVEFAVAAAPYASVSEISAQHELAGAMLVFATDALTLKLLNAALDGERRMDVVSRVA